MFSLAGKVALVTGGTRGIGKAIAIALAQAQATVFFTYAGSVDKAAEVEQTLQSHGSKGGSFQADAADFNRAHEVVDAIIQQTGQLHIVVNNAGITMDNLLLRMTEEQWDQVQDTNLKSVFNYTKAAAKPMLKQRNGVFINISSVVGLDGNAGQSNYAASKAGIIGFTQSIARELASRSIRANAVAPGFIATEMTNSLPEAELQKWVANIPLGRAGTADEVAQLCVYLASDAAAYITGQTIRIDGGM
jgi:3-oxoacyl-[acyl-carrier protein] reductase